MKELAIEQMNEDEATQFYLELDNKKDLLIKNLKEEIVDLKQKLKMKPKRVIIRKKIDTKKEEELKQLKQYFLQQQLLNKLITKTI